MNLKPEAIIQEFEQVAGNRGTWEAHWREVGQYVLPRYSDFGGDQSTPGEKRTQKIYDATAIMALERFAAAMESMIIPRTQRWHRLVPEEPVLREDQAIKEYLDDVNELLFRVRYSPRSNFASQAHEVFMCLGAFGSGGLFVEDVPGEAIRYRVAPLGTTYISEDVHGLPDKAFRHLRPTARQAAQLFGRDRLPDKVLHQLQNNKSEERSDYVHAIIPNPDPKGRGWRAMPWVSVYIATQGKQVVGEGGFRTFPLPFARYVVAPGEIYGRSPAMQVLAEIKMANEMNRTMLKSAQREVDPPLLLTEDGALQAFDLRSGALNYGALADDGAELVKPLRVGADLASGEALVDKRRQAINDAFLVTLFQILVEQPTMTATEAMIRAQEKGALLAPVMGRIQSEFLGRLIERELDILSVAGVLPPMPPQLAEAGGAVAIEYESPASRAIRAEDGVAIMRTLEAIGPVAQIKPEVVDNFDPDEIARELAEINGVPAKIIRPMEEVEKDRKTRALIAQAQGMLEAAPVAAEAAKVMGGGGAAQASAGGSA